MPRELKIDRWQNVMIIQSEEKNGAPRRALVCLLSFVWMKKGVFWARANTLLPKLSDSAAEQTNVGFMQHKFFIHWSFSTWFAFWLMALLNATREIFSLDVNPSDDKGKIDAADCISDKFQRQLFSHALVTHTHLCESAALDSFFFST